MSSGIIAVLDVGKINAKLTVTEAAAGTETRRAERPSPARDGLLDVAGITAWLKECLSAVPERRRLLAAPDYEEPAHDAFDAEYAKPYRDQ